MRTSFRARAELALRSDAQLWTTLVYAGVAAGCLFRLVRWIENRGLWLDEAQLAINLINTPLNDLFGPLQFLQTAPPGYLLVEKGAESIIGDAEWSLRLFPLLASLLSVVLLAYIARRVLAPPAAALAVVLFATAEPLLLRTADLKHYSTDVVVTTALVALYLWTVSGRPEPRTWRLVALGAAASIALWLSFPAAFTLAAIVAAAAVRGWETRSRTLLTAAAVGALLALASFGAVYAVTSSNVSRSTASIFGGRDEQLAGGALKTAENAWWTFIDPGGFDNETNSLAALLAGFGIAGLLRRESLDRLALFALPFALAAAADVLDRYPLGGRFSFFLVPLMLVLVARGAQELAAWSRRPLIVGTGLALFLVASPLAIAAYHAVERRDTGAKPVLRHLVREWRDGDSLYVYPDSQYELRYYSECQDCSISGDEFPWPTRPAPPGPPGRQYVPALESVPPTVIIGSRDDPAVPLGALEDLPPTGRIWLFFTGGSLTHNGLDDESLILWTLSRDGALLLQEFGSRSARLYLIDRKP